MPRGGRGGARPCSSGAPAHGTCLPPPIGARVVYQATPKVINQALNLLSLPDQKYRWLQRRIVSQFSRGAKEPPRPEVSPLQGRSERTLLTGASLLFRSASAWNVLATAYRSGNA